MCLIAVKKAGVGLPKQEYLESAEWSNCDGIGICYKKAGSDEVVIKKDFVSATSLGTWLEKHITKEDTLVIHFRFATHGRKDVGNRHPFPLTKNKELLREPNVICTMALAHNGVLSNMKRSDVFSDTQKFVLGIMSDEAVKGNLKSSAVHKLISDFVGNDKVVVLDREGNLFLWGNFIEEDGVLYSNTGYKPFRERFVQYSSWAKPVHEGECEGCGKKAYLQEVTAVQGETNMLVYLCKKCRKKIKKGTLQLNDLNLVVTDYDEDTEVKCNSCFELCKEKELVDTVYGKLCARCARDYNFNNDVY